MGWFAIRTAYSKAPARLLSSSLCENEGEAHRIPHKPLISRRWVHLGILALFLLLAVGCSTARQSTFDPAGPVASKQLELFNVLLWVMVAVFILVEGALLYAIIRFRRRPGQELPAQTHGHLTLEIVWTIVPTILIMALGIWTVFAIFDLEEPPASADNILDVTVTAHQWWFEFEYPDAGGGKRITTANELRIPVDVPVRLTLLSDDVIHSFWVPKLAGKLDMIPTRSNQMWLQADANKIDEYPATFFGQCAEFCGIAHALMRFRVIVFEQDEYDAWVQNYGEPPATSEQAQRGKAVFGQCVMCHTIDGGDDRELQAGRLDAFLIGGALVPAPNLTDLRTRSTLGAGLMDLNTENLRLWLKNPDDVKPGNSMSDRAAHLYSDGSDISLSEDQLNDIIAYLLNLQ